MREIEFQESGMKNFGPYTEPMILPFDNNQLNLLTGPNGIGKTMSLDSIPFTLYGITSKKAKGDDVVNNRVGKNCKTWVKFKVNDDQYIVTRYHKYTRYGNTVILNKNGEDIKKGHREVLPEVERLICPQKAFMNTLMFGQKVKDFFTDLVDSDKKEIFRKILGLEQYLELYKEADLTLKKLKKLKNKLTNQIDIDKGLLEDTISQIAHLSDLKVKFETQKKEDIKNLELSNERNDVFLKKWTDTLEILLSEEKEELKDILSELSRTQSELNSIQKDTDSKIDSLEKMMEMKLLELRNEARDKKQEISDQTASQVEVIRKKVSEILEGSFDYKQKIKDLKHKIDLKINKLKSDQENSQRSIDQIEDSVLNNESSICPTCSQDVTEVKEHLCSKVVEYQSEIKDYQETIDKLEIEKENLEAEYQESLVPVNDEAEQLNNQIQELVDKQIKDQSEITSKLTGLENSVMDLAEKQKQQILDSQSDLKKELEQKIEEIEYREQEREKFDNEVKEVKDKISDLKQEIKSIEKQIENKTKEEYDETQLNGYISRKSNLKTAIEHHKSELENLDKQITIHEFWKTGFSSSGIPSMLIDDSIPFMNDKIAEYLELLTNGRYIVSFDTLAETKAGEFRDKISVHVIDTHTKANSRVQLSGGQTRIIDIATILTLGDLQSNIQDVKINILLFDEIFDALDYENATYVSKVLNKLKVDKSIYVISHQHQDQLEADEILEFK